MQGKHREFHFNLSVATLIWFDCNLSRTQKRKQWVDLYHKLLCYILLLLIRELKLLVFNKVSCSYFQLQIWDCSSGLLKRKIPTHHPVIDVCALSVNDEHYLAALTDKVIRLHKWSQQISQFYCHTMTVNISIMCSIRIIDK